MFKEAIIDTVVGNIRNTPDANAFCIDDCFFTYKEFGDSIINIRSLIRSRDVKNKNIGLVTNNDLETYASIFALWLDGYSYVPLHIKQPIDRCVDIIDQVGIDTILDSSDKTRYLEELVVNTQTIANSSCDLTPFDGISEDELAYILFTSGSTGKPKGVTLSRKNIATFIDSFWKSGIHLSSADRCLQCFDLTFDVSVQCYLAALISGACVYTVPYGEGKYLQVASLVDEYKLTFAVMAPSMLRYMQPFFTQIDMNSIKQMILTAEACPKSLLETAYKYCKDVVLYDFYGPTETTIYCTYYKLKREDKNKELNGIISIGKPMANCRGLILDENQEELPTGEKGELCIAGSQVTQGYWKNDEKNASSFFYKEVDGEKLRFYHTGDLCYKDEEGDIMYSGRMDNQVKVQGFRIELGEIEYHAREVSKRNTVCIANDENGINVLYLFIEGKQMDTKPIIGYMKSKMPHYMIPSHIQFIESFPLNNSDKIDRPKIKRDFCNI